MDTEQDLQAQLRPAQENSAIAEEELLESFENVSGTDSNARIIPTGMEQGVEPLPWRSFFIFLCIATLIGVIVWVAGQFGRGAWPQWLATKVLQSSPVIQIIDARLNRVLIVETIGTQHRLLIQETDNASWLLVSLDDYTANAPVLSPDGTAVVYRSTQDNGRIIVVALNANRRSQIGVSSLQTIAANLLVCEWTPISWSPDSTRIAFYACNPELNQSMLVWTPAMVDQPQVVSGTKIISTNSRQLQWLNNSQIVITQPSSASADKAQVMTFDVK